MLIRFLDWSHQVAPDFLSTLWRGTWQGAIFIVLVWLLCRAFPKIPATTRSWLWLLACGQMLFRLGSPSFLTLAILPAKPTVQIERSISINPLPDQNDSYHLRPINSTYSSHVGRPHEMPPVSWEMGLLWAWMVGSLTLAIAFGLRCWNTRRLIQASEPATSELIQGWVKDLSNRVGVKRPQVLQSTHAKCAMLAGWIDPVIILPINSEKEFTVSENHMAIAHELVHLRRKDIWLSSIEALTLILFFFHPLARLAIQESTTSREEVCDQEAMRISNSSAAAYARLLLTTAQTGPAITVMGSAFGYRLIHRRISMLKTSPIVTNPKARRALTSLVVLGAICALPWCVTAQSTHLSKTKPTPKINSKKSPVKKTKAHKANLRPITSSAPLQKSVSRPGAVSAGYPMDVPPAPSILPASGFAIAPPIPATGVSRSNSRIPARDNPEISIAAGGFAPTVAAIPAGSKPQKANSAFAGRENLLPVGYPPQIAPIPDSTVPYASPELPIATGSAPSAVLPSKYQSVSVHEGWLDIDFKEVEIHDAIRLMFDALQTDYVLKSNIPREHVNLHLHHASLDNALTTILESVTSPVSFKVEGNVYKVFPKTP